MPGAPKPRGDDAAREPARPRDPRDVLAGRFTHNGDGNCTAAGMDARTFFEIDTGLSSSWTQGLTMGGGDSQQREHDAIAGYVYRDRTCK